MPSLAAFPETASDSAAWWNRADCFIGLVLVSNTMLLCYITCIQCSLSELSQDVCLQSAQCIHGGANISEICSMMPGNRNKPWAAGSVFLLFHPTRHDDLGVFMSSVFLMSADG